MKYIVCDPMHNSFELSDIVATIEEAKAILRCWKNKGRKYAEILIVNS